MRIELCDELNGHWVEIEAARLTIGALEDLELGVSYHALLTAFAQLITASSLWPAETPTRDGLRGLTIAQFNALGQAIQQALSLPKVA